MHPVLPFDPDSPFPRCAGEQVCGRLASAGDGTDVFCGSGPALSPATSQLTSPGHHSNLPFSSFTGTSPGRDRLALCAGAKSRTAGDLGCLYQ